MGVWSLLHSTVPLMSPRISSETNVTVSGIDGVTVGTLDMNRVSDTAVTVELTFNGDDFDTIATLTFTVGATAIANYNGPALAAEIRVTATEIEARIAFESFPPVGYTPVTLNRSGRVWGVPTRYTSDSNPGTVAYMVLGKLMGCDFVAPEASRRSKVYIKTQALGNLDNFTSETVCGKTSSRLSSSWDGVRLTHLRFFDESGLPNIKEAVYNDAIGQIEILGDNENRLVTTGVEYLLSVPAGISLIHVPLKVTAVNGVSKTIETVGDLYDTLGGASTVSLLITHDTKTQRWISYVNDRDKGGDADKALTDDLGIIAVMTAPASVLLSGDALGTNRRSSITLHPGTNLVGIPLNDSRLTRVSDLFTLKGIAGNVLVIIVSDNGMSKVVAQPGDDGNIRLTGGQSFILTAREAVTVEITGTGWSNTPGTTVAPPIAQTGIQADGTTSVLAVTGSILPPVGGASLPRLGGPDFAVTVKNLSTGIVDTALANGKGAGYQFTFVDIETGRAAQAGDILEITAHSPDPLIGVHPVRHTVTIEDVKRSHIQLAELVAYEIPAKTELLLNYPNPFNPETWIPYRLAEDAFVTVTIYDQRGRMVRDIVVGHRIAGVYESRSKAIHWDGRTEFGERVASGIYFYTLTAGDYTAMRKMVILK